MNSPGKLLTNLLKFAIPVAIIAFLLFRIKPEEWEALSSHPKDYTLLAGALLIALAAVSVSFSRWWLLVRCQDIELSLLEAFRLSSICFLLNFVAPGSVGGDFFKAIFLAKRRPGRRVAAVASVMVDRGVGLYGLLLLGTLALLLHPSADLSAESAKHMQQIKYAAAILAALGTSAIAFLVFGGRIVDRLISWGSELPVVGSIVDKIGPPLRMFHHHPVAFAIAILMSLAVHSMLTMSLYLIAKSLYGSVPTLQEHFIIVPIGMLAAALPIAPAGLGVFEAAIEWLYDLIPAEPTDASGVAVALVFEIVKLVMALLGTIFYWTASEEVRGSLEEFEELSEHSDVTEHDFADETLRED